MDILVTDEHLNSKFIIDEYESLLFSRRFCNIGTLELKTIGTPDILVGDIIVVDTTELNMYIVDTIRIKETQTTYECSDITSVLKRRISLKKETMTLPADECIVKLIYDNFIKTSQNRMLNLEIHNLLNKDFPIVDLTIKMGENVWDKINDLSIKNSIGIKCEYDGTYYIIKLYNGVDMSYSQTDNPWTVVNNDLSDIEVVSTSENICDSVTIIGDDDICVTYTPEDVKTISFEKKFTSEIEKGDLTVETYKELLLNECIAKLQLSNVTAVTGTVKHDSSGIGLGDIIQIETNSFSERVMVMSMIHDITKNGYLIYPEMKIIGGDKS